MQLVTLTPEQISARVNGSNSFTREEIVAHRSIITKFRAEKRERLAKTTGSELGVIVDRYRAEGFTFADLKEKEGKRMDSVTLVLKRQSSKSMLERYQEEMAKLQQKIANLQSVSV